MPTPLEIKQKQLDEVRTAISAVMLRGQAYMIMDGGAQRQVTRASLRWLTDYEKKLELEVDRLGRGGIGVNYGFPR